MVKITINGKTTEVERGTTVLNAARELGIEIPTLCDHPELTPYGGCRLCLVEVEGARVLQPSCTLPVSNNMIVHTDTEKIHEARKFILSMIFSERNHFCPYCQVSGGDCDLQNSAYDEGMTHWPIMPNWKPYPVDASHPFIILEHNRCILCRLCVRACSELAGNFTLSFEERGADSNLVADLGLPLGESSCIGCGTCVQVCPTGSLIDRWSAYQGKETEVDSTKTICQGCSIGCGIDILTRDNRLVRIEGDWGAEINNGVICEVGRFHPMVEERERVLTPMIRVDGKLKASTWKDALSAAGEMINTNKGNFTAVASSRMSMEALNTLKGICDTFEAKSTLSTEESTAISALFRTAAATNEIFEAKIDQIKDGDCYLLIGEDTTKDHQVVSFFAKRAVPAGAKLIQITASSTGFDNFASESLFVENKSQAEFISSLSSLISSGSTDIENTAKRFKLDPTSLQNVVDALSSAQKAVIVFGTRYAFYDSGAVLDAVMALNKKISGNMISTKGNINSVGTSVLGFNPTKSGTDSQVVLLALADEDLPQSFSKKFEKSPNSIVFSSYLSSLTTAASIVFPVQNWLEESGHFITSDGHILEGKPALEAPESVLSNEESLSRLADELKINQQKDWKSIVMKAQSPVSIEKS